MTYNIDNIFTRHTINANISKLISRIYINSQKFKSKMCIIWRKNKERGHSQNM